VPGGGVESSRIPDPGDGDGEVGIPQRQGHCSTRLAAFFKAVSGGLQAHADSFDPDDLDMGQADGAEAASMNSHRMGYRLLDRFVWLN
jgi:hypothetical protein